MTPSLAPRMVFELRVPIRIYRYLDDSKPEPVKKRSPAWDCLVAVAWLYMTMNYTATVDIPNLSPHSNILCVCVL